MTTPIVKLININKIYHPNLPTAAQVLFDINLQINQGEFCALVGPSGSGKSTLLNIIGLLDSPSSGRLLLNGQDTAQLDEAALTGLRGDNIGFIFQFHHLLAAFSVLDNVLMPALISGQSTDSINRQYALQLLAQVGLSGQEQKLPHQISGGQQQRVAIARALFSRPQLLLADEPTGNLDSRTAAEVFALLRRLTAQQNSACLMVTHDMGLAAKCDKIFTVIDGKISA